MTISTPPPPPAPTEHREQSHELEVPRSRPKKLTRPRRSRTSQANLYSPENAERKSAGDLKLVLPFH
eukprot:scaffold13293_cov120-Cylindrotheca_fusiformis.AAC.9